MSIRRRLFLSFLVILALFAVNMAIYRQGNVQREASFDDVEHAMERLVLVGDIDKALEERRQALRGIKVLVDIGSSFEPGQVEDQFQRVEEIDAMVAKLQPASEDAAGEDAIGDGDPLVKAFVLRYGMLREEWITVYQGLKVTPVEADGEAVDGEAGDGESAAGTVVGGGPDPESTTGDDVTSATGDEDPAATTEFQEVVAEGLEEGEAETTAEPVAAPEPVDLAQLAVEQLATLEERERQRVGEATAQFYEDAATTDRIALWIFALSALVALGVALWVSSHLNRGLQALESGPGGSVAASSTTRSPSAATTSSPSWPPRSTRCPKTSRRRASGSRSHAPPPRTPTRRRARSWPT